MRATMWRRRTSSVEKRFMCLQRRISWFDGQWMRPVFRSDIPFSWSIVHLRWKSLVRWIKMHRMRRSGRIGSRPPVLVWITALSLVAVKQSLPLSLRLCVNSKWKLSTMRRRSCFQQHLHLSSWSFISFPKIGFTAYLIAVIFPVNQIIRKSLIIDNLKNSQNETRILYPAKNASVVNWVTKETVHAQKTMSYSRVELNVWNALAMGHL